MLETNSGISKKSMIEGLKAFKEYQKNLKGPKGACDTWNYEFKTNHPGYKIISSLFRIIANQIWRIEIEGLDNIPKNTNVIFVPNHNSHLDGPLLAPYFPTAPAVMGDEKLFRAQWFRYFARLVNIFPIRKGTKSTAIVDYAISRVSGGDSFLIFPEGQRHKNPSKNKCNPGKLGAGKLAHASTIPVIPLFISGAEFAMPLGGNITKGLGLRSIKIKLKFGSPIELDDLRKLETSKETSEKVVKRIMERIENLRPEGSYIVQKTRIWQLPTLKMFRKIQNIKREHY